MAAAELEGSKVFAKEFMQKHNIPTAASESFSRLEDAESYLVQVDHRVGIKADGLAGGKGVVLPESQKEALEEVRRMMNGEFTSAGPSVVIEEFMEGDEISLLTLSDGNGCLFSCSVCVTKGPRRY